MLNALVDRQSATTGAANAQLRVWRRLVVVAAVAAVIVLNYLSQQNNGRGVALVFAAVVCGLAVIANWRWGLSGLLLFIPYIGATEVLTYPNTSMAVLAKDILFVAPCYVALAMGMATRQVSIPTQRMPWKLLFVLTGLLLAEFFNPNLASLLVGLIGLKVWLLYVPMAFVVPIAIDSAPRLLLLLRVVAYGSIAPAAIGLLEFLLIHFGKAGLVYSLYGRAADAMFFKGISFTLGDGNFLSRIPSTLPASAQYMYFLFGAITCGMALTFLETAPGSVRGAWLVVMLGSVALLTSGERGAFIYVPFFFIALSLLLGGFSSIARLAPVLGGSFLTAVLLFGGAGYGLFTLVSGLVSLYGGEIFTGHGGQSIPRIIESAGIGLGPGMDTQSAFRYGAAFQQLTWVESWYGKVAIETGVVGLILVLCIWAIILWRGWHLTRALAERRLQRVGMCCLAYLLTMLFIAFKASPFDTDPANVMIWIFAGLLLRLPDLAPAVAKAAEVASPFDRSGLRFLDREARWIRKG